MNMRRYQNKHVVFVFLFFFRKSPENDTIRVCVSTGKCIRIIMFSNATEDFRSPESWPSALHPVQRYAAVSADLADAAP